MVKTRGQKRKLDEYEEDLSLLVIDTTANCYITKNKKRTLQSCTNTLQSEPQESEPQESEPVMTDDDFTTIITEISDHDSDEEYDEEYDDNYDEDYDDNYDDYDENIVNTKQIKKIIKKSIKINARQSKEFLKPSRETEYDTFNELVNSIYDGDFFERVPLEDCKRKLKDTLTEEDLKVLTDELQVIKLYYHANSPSIIDILRMNVSLEQKQKLLEKVHCLVNSDVLTHEYNSNLKFLTSNISNANDPELMKLEEQILKSSLNSEFADSYRTKILKSKMSFTNKVIAYKKLQIMETYEEKDTSEYAKYKAWMDSLLSIPFGVYNESGITKESPLNDIKDYIKNIRNTLDRKLSFLEKPKDQIINIVTQMMRNPDVNINAIGLHGGPGTGKCMAFNTPIIMFDGTIKMVQDIQVGELLMGDDSTPRTVLTLGSGRDTMYKITNTNGETYTVNSEHILCLKYTDSKYILDDTAKNRFKVKWFNNIKIKTDIEYFYYKNKDKNIILEKATVFLHDLNENKKCEVSVKEYLKLTAIIKNKLKGYSVPIEFSKKQLTFDPYMFGMWLGNNCQDRFVIPKQDSIIKYFTENVEQYNCQLQLTENSDYIITGDNFVNTLEKHNLITNKHIPNIYKCNSRKNRLELLAGLIDNDSYLYSHTSGYEFSQSLEHEQLIDDIMYLARSLGFACYKNKIKTNQTYDGTTYLKETWKFCISGKGLDEIPTLCYKIDKNQRELLKNVLLSEITLEKLPEDNYYGFELDNNHKYVLGNFIVTHNTSIVESISKALNRPFKMISLGGESDASSLTGHNFTYIGSNPGALIDILRNTSTMNPIVLLDELDKIGETQQGKEIIGTLIHLTDSTTNHKYNHDKYFSGIEFDLSKVLFVFTYNDPSKVDRILADRLFKIKVDNYNFTEKLDITNKHIIPYMLDKFKFNKDDIVFTEKAVKDLVNSSNKADGMRDIKTKIKIILSRINTLFLTNEEDCIVNLKYKKLYPYYKSLPVIIPNEHIDIFLDESISTEKSNEPPPHMYI